MSNTAFRGTTAHVFSFRFNLHMLIHIHILEPATRQTSTKTPAHLTCKEGASDTQRI